MHSLTVTCFPSKVRLCIAQSRSVATAPPLPLTFRNYPPRAVLKNKSTVRKTTHKYVAEPSTTPQPRYPVKRALFRRSHQAIQSSGDEQVIISLVTKKFDRFPRQFSSSGRVVDNTTRLLTKRSYIPALIALRDRLATEQVHIPSVKDLIFLASLPNTTRSRELVLPSSFRKIIEAKDFTYTNLLALFKKMSRLNTPSMVLLKTMIVFLKSHPSPWPVMLYPSICRQVLDLGERKGNIELVLDALSVLPQSGIANAILSDAHASLNAVQSKNQVVSAAVDETQKKGAVADLPDRSPPVGVKSPYRPFARYGFQNSGFLPTHDNFGHLLGALNEEYKSYIQHPLRNTRPTISSPRALYRTMTAAFNQYQPSQLTTSLLNTILHSFVYSRDYAGAYVMIRAFHENDVPVNIQTYLIVICHLMNRIIYGMGATKRHSSDMWTDKFLGLSLLSDHPARSAMERGYNQLTRYILNASNRFAFVFADSPFNGVGEKRYNTPTVEALFGKEKISFEQSFDAVPLERLMKKALLTELGLVHRRFVGATAASQYLWSTIRRAEIEMGKTRPTLKAK